jgi:hypothetical protein
MSKNIREDLKKFIIEKVKKETSPDKPYFIIKWSGLFELTRAYGVDLLELIDSMEKEGLIKKALLPSKKNRSQKILAIYLPNMVIPNKTKNLLQEFQDFLKK